jgi:hypothetical protein
MRFSKALFVAAALFLSLAAVPSDAQVVVDQNRGSTVAPDGAFGVGFNNKGGHIQYALGPAFHIGLNLNLDFQKQEEFSESYYNFGPYAKFLFEGSVINPYIWGGLGVIQPNTGSFSIAKDPNDTTKTIQLDLPEAQLRIVLAAGGEYFFSPNVGVYGHVNLLDAKLSPTPSTVGFGLQGGVAGVEFFF